MKRTCLERYNHGAPTAAIPAIPTIGAKRGADAATPMAVAVKVFALPIAVECKKTSA
jgi:hypothetical protein